MKFNDGDLVCSFKNRRLFDRAELNVAIVISKFVNFGLYNILFAGDAAITLVYEHDMLKLDE